MGKDKYENEELLKYGFPEAGMPSLASRTYSSRYDSGAPPGYLVPR